MLMRTFSLFILSLLFFSGLANSESLDEMPSFVLPEEISFKRDVMPVFMKAVQSEIVMVQVGDRMDLWDTTRKVTTIDFSGGNRPTSKLGET